MLKQGVAVLALGTLLGCSGSSTAAQVAPTPSPTTSPTPVITGAPLPTLTLAPAKPLRSTADFGGGVTGRVLAVRSLQVTATSPGDISGPALAFTLRLINRSAKAVSLVNVAVTAAYGSTPASPLTVPSTKELAGSLAPGASAEGVYVFGVPKGERTAISLTLTLAADRPVITLRGAVS